MRAPLSDSLDPGPHLDLDRDLDDARRGLDVAQRLADAVADCGDRAVIALAAAVARSAARRFDDLVDRAVDMALEGGHAGA